MPRIRHIGGHQSILTAKAVGNRIPTFVSVDEYRYTNSTGSATNIAHTLPVPGGWLPGDLVCVFTFAEFTQAGIATAGFRTIFSGASLDSIGVFSILRATTSGNSIVTSAVSVPNGSSIKVMACVIRGARGADFYSFTSATISSNKRTATLVSRTALESGLFLMFAANNIPTPGTITTPPAGMTINQFSGLGLNMALASQKVAIGDDLSKTLTFSNGSTSDDGGGVGVLLIG